MLHINSYDFLIFDCDGVILDSNELKIQAMETALVKSGCQNSQVSELSNLFRKNFGKSRFYHVSAFAKLINKDESWETQVLEYYSSMCRELYRNSDLTPGFLDFVSRSKAKHFIASGSEQAELRSVFEEKGLSHHFEKIYGSPKKKSQIVSEVVKTFVGKKFLMIGDAVSDYEAAKDNNIDFLCYIPFSNVESELRRLSADVGFDILDNWSELC
mgnify:CR=1 FL=1